MSYFLFPEIHHTIDFINIKGSMNYNSESNLYISLTLNNYLNKLKLQIDNNCDNWDFVKKYTVIRCK